MEQAFRHEIGVPDNFYPATWLRQKIRRRSGTKQNLSTNELGHEFRRKKGEIVSKNDPQGRKIIYDTIGKKF